MKKPDTHKHWFLELMKVHWNLMSLLLIHPKKNLKKNIRKSSERNGMKKNGRTTLISLEWIWLVMEHQEITLTIKTPSTRIFSLEKDQNMVTFNLRFMIPSNNLKSFRLMNSNKSKLNAQFLQQEDIIGHKINKFLTQNQNLKIINLIWRYRRKIIKIIWQAKNSMFLSKILVSRISQTLQILER